MDSRAKLYAEPVNPLPLNSLGRYTVCMEAVSVKDEARRLIERLPEDATWDDLMHEIYVRQAIEAGLEDSRAGNLTNIEDVRARLGLSRQ